MEGWKREQKREGQQGAFVWALMISVPHLKKAWRQFLVLVNASREGYVGVPFTRRA